MLYLSSLIYNIVVLPIRVILSLGHTVVKIMKECRLPNLSVRQQVDLVRVVIGTLTTWFLLEFTNPSVVYHWIRG